VKKKRLGYIRRSYFILGTCALLVSGSCNETVKVELCSERLPQFEKKMDDAIAALDQMDMKNTPKGRYLASVTDPMKIPEGLREIESQEERDKWSRWAEQELGRIQTHMDITVDDPALVGARGEMSLAANHLVSFSGYAILGETSKMLQALVRVREYGRSARRLVCSQEQGKDL